MSKGIRDIDRFLLDAYTGEGGFHSGDYLIRHGAETDEELEKRKDYSVYPNYVKKVAGSYLNHLFRQPPSRQGENQVWLKFCANADGAGNEIDSVMRRCFRLAMLLGTVYLTVDRPKGKARTRADEVDLTPYIAIRQPDSVIDSKVSGNGRLSYIVFSELKDGDTVYRRFDKEVWKLTKDKEGEEVIEQGEHGLGRPPVVILHSTDPIESDSIKATPWIWDVAWLNFDLFQTHSEKRTLFRSQAFAILTVPCSTDKMVDAASTMTIGARQALVYSPGEGKPDYIAPPGHPIALYMEESEAIVKRIYEASGLEFVGGTKQSQSGIALGFRFTELNDSLAVMAGFVENAERQIVELVCAWSDDEFDGHIAWPRKFSVIDLERELRIALDAETLEISATFQKELHKRIARAVLGNAIKQETVALIDKEIEEGVDPYKHRIEEGAQ